MYDYHNHTCFSYDSEADMEAMIDAGTACGLMEIAITDHYDPKYSRSDKDIFIDLERYHSILYRLHREKGHNIKVIRGIELGLQKKSLAEVGAAAGKYHHDFVLGSFHCAENMELCSNDYFSGRSPEQTFRGFYRYVYECLQLYHDYDVLGHLNIIERYAKTIPEEGIYMDLVEKILRLVLENGKGIELNTSSFRYGMKDRLTPSENMLKMYRELGGEIITVGSDAHRPADVGSHIKEAYTILKSIGFTSVTTFEDRKPKQVSLE